MGRVFNRELASVIAIVSLSAMSMSVLQPILPLYITSIGITPALMGLMFALGMVGMVFGESTGGWLADKIGVRIPLGIGTIFCIPLLLLFVFTQNIPFIFVLFLGWGIVRAAVFGPGLGYIGGTVPFAQKTMYMAVYAASLSVSRSIGSLVGGVVGEHLGYDWNFYIAAGIALAGGLLVVFALRKIPLVKPALPPLTVPAGSGVSVKAPYRSRAFLAQCTVGALCWISVGVVAPFLPLLAVQVAKVAETEVGLLFTISSIVGAGLMIPMGRFSDRKNKKTMIILGLLIIAAGLSGVALSKNYGMIVAFMIVQSIGNAIFIPVAVAMLSDAVPRNWQNTAMGIYGGCEDIGVVIGSALGGVVWDNAGPQAAFLLLGTTSAVLGAIVALALLKNKPAPAQPDP